MVKNMKTGHKPTLRVLHILEIISKNNNELTFTDIYSKLKISKSTIQPILKTLVEENFINYNEVTKTYSIGFDFFKNAQVFLNDESLFVIIKNEMKKIVDKCDEICQMGTIDKSDPRKVFYIAKENSKQPIQLISSVGKSLPAHATALGKCLLTRYNDSEIRNLYSDGLEKLTENTITDINQFIQNIDDVRKNGYATEDGESSSNITCIAFPLISEGHIAASISISIPKYRATDEKKAFVKDVLYKHCKKINEILLDIPLPF